MGSVSRMQVRDAIVQGACKGCYSPGGQVRDAVVQGACKGYHSPGSR